VLQGITKLLSTGAIDTSFSAGTGFNSGIYQPNGLMRISGETSFYSFGYFTTFDGVSEIKIARFFGNGSLDTSFNFGEVGFNGDVYYGCIIWTDKLLLTGAFTEYNNIPSNGTIILNSDSTIYQTFNNLYLGIFFIGNKLYGQQSGSLIELILTHP
jgi:hypothetical protein